MADQANVTVCRDCGGTNVASRGVVVAVQPYERPRLAGSPRFQKVVERKFCCQDCSSEFSLTEEVYED
jgi:hypothetical protein